MNDILKLLFALFALPLAVLTAKRVFKKVAYATNFQLIGKLVDRVDTQEKVIALTYDDGPHPTATSQLLDVLNRHQVKATFFVLGKQAEMYPDTIRHMVDRGHEVGNHSYSHPRMVWKTPAFLQAEIERTDRLLRSLGITGNILFRAPFGLKFAILPYVLKKLNKTNILWNVDPQDYAVLDPDEIVDRLINSVTPGSIILMHDAVDDLKTERSATVKATDLFVQKMLDRGYQFKTVSELLATAQ
jgi:peptidoglycan-N-acetylglucosamine deacetylase